MNYLGFGYEYVSVGGTYTGPELKEGSITGEATSSFFSNNSATTSVFFPVPVVGAIPFFNVGYKLGEFSGPGVLSGGLGFGPEGGTFSVSLVISNVNSTSVPEPSTITLLGIGLLGLLGVCARRRTVSAS
jgi:hypothetical protein